MPIPPHRVPKKKDTNMTKTTYTFVQVANPQRTGTIYHHGLSINDVGALLKKLKRNLYNHLHELHGPDNFHLTGYGAIQAFYIKATQLPNIEDHIINPVLQQSFKMNFIREVDIMRLVTEIQTLATKPGNEKDIHELSTVLKYVMSPESVPNKESEWKRKAELYHVKFMSGPYFHDVEVLACDEDEALEMFKSYKMPYTDIVTIAKRK